jgi:hypothetical protein
LGLSRPVLMYMLNTSSMIYTTRVDHLAALQGNRVK